MATVTAPSELYTLVQRTIISLDIAGSSRPEHDDWMLIGIRNRLYRALHQSIHPLSTYGPDSYEILDRGDGAILLIRPEVPIHAVVLAMVKRFPRYIREVNDGHRNRIRVRVAVHHGTVIYDEHGPAGRAIVQVCRMQTSGVLRDRLARARSDTVVMLSDAVFLRGLPPRAGRRELPDSSQFTRVSDEVKQIAVAGWVHEAG